MHNQLYIPQKIVVGFQERSDTYTGKLAYVIYRDHTGKLRKEASWNGWRDKDIETLELDNTPQDGYTFNKGIKRDAYYFGSGRSMIRVYDVRDFEFEISVPNLIGVLMHSDVSKRDIVEKCVYAWSGTELILLPVNSVEYQESVKHTSKQGEKVSAKSLVVGHTYSIKKDSTTRVVYLGRFERWDRERFGDSWSVCQVKKKDKKHVFIELNEHNHIHARDPASFIAYCESNEVHPDFASLMDKYYSTLESQPVVGLAVVTSCDHCTGTWMDLGDNNFVQFSFHDTPEKYVRDETASPDRYGRFIHNPWRRAPDPDNYVTVSRFGTFSEAHSAYMQSGIRDTRYSYHYSDTAYHAVPAQPLPGMTVNLEQLEEIRIALNKAYQLFVLYDIKTVSTEMDYWERQKLIGTRKAAFYKNNNLGTLHFTLQDGKVAKTYL